MFILALALGERLLAAAAALARVMYSVGRSVLQIPVAGLRAHV